MKFERYAPGYVVVVRRQVRRIPSQTMPIFASSFNRQVYDLEHLLHDECTRRAEADALTEVRSGF